MAKHEPIPQIEGFETEQRTISIVAANVWAMGLMAIAAVVGMLLLHWVNADFSFKNAPFQMLILCLSLFVGIVVHELIHGLTWMLVTHSGFSHLRFGFMTGAVYCHIDVPMTKRAYVIGALMPLLLVGVVPYVISIIVGSWLLMLIAAIMIGSAMGDVMIVWTIRHEDADTLVYDHPSEGGCLVYRKITPQ